jgi:hypothetical protein
MTTENLWGSLDFEPVTTPKSILEKQANYLTERTRGTLQGRVGDQSEGEVFIFDLDIVAPSLNKYRYTVLTVRHTIELYPISVFAEAQENRGVLCHNQAEFETALSGILQAPRTRRVISALLSQSGYEPPPF